MCAEGEKKKSHVDKEDPKDVRSSAMNLEVREQENLQ